MYSSWFSYKIIAQHLHETFSDTYLQEVFSNHKDELILNFAAKNFNQSLFIKFADGELFFEINEDPPHAGRKSIYQFKPLNNLQLSKTTCLDFDRVICFHFGEYKLWFKGFGRFGNVILTDAAQTENLGIFRQNIKQDLKWLGIDEKKEPLKPTEFIKKFLSVSSYEIKQRLNKNGFDDADESKKIALLKDENEYLNHPEFGVVTDGNLPVLLFYPIVNSEIIGHGWNALLQFSRLYLNSHRLFTLREQLIRRTTHRIKQLNKMVGDMNSQLEEISMRRSFKELGDILLSYSHKIKPGVREAFLPDYYTGNPIRIKINPEKSVADNAAKFYAKAKNENIELCKIEENLTKTTAELQHQEFILEKALGSSDFKFFKNQESKTADKSDKTKPYKEFEYAGYNIWVGKSAKNNDELLRLAAKNDLWLHARNDAGSHVVIRKKGNAFPESVIAFGAKLAAQNSRSKSQSLVSVIYTEKKFVVKPKNAAPGEVKVLKEKNIDVRLRE